MGTAAQKRPTPEQLQQRAQRLLYELLMAENLARLLAGKPSAPDGWEDLSGFMACVESLLANMLAICSFLYPSKAERKRASAGAGGKALVLAGDFCPEGWQARAWPGAGKVRKTIARDLRQLGSAALPAERSWEYARLLAALKLALRDFASAADRLPDAIRRELLALLEAHEQDGGRGQPAPALPLPHRDAIAAQQMSRAPLEPRATPEE